MLILVFHECFGFGFVFGFVFFKKMQFIFSTLLIKHKCSFSGQTMTYLYFNAIMVTMTTFLT